MPHNDSYNSPKYENRNQEPMLPPSAYHLSSKKCFFLQYYHQAYSNSWNCTESIQKQCFGWRYWVHPMGRSESQGRGMGNRWGWESYPSCSNCLQSSKCCSPPLSLQRWVVPTTWIRSQDVCHFHPMSLPSIRAPRTTIAHLHSQARPTNTTDSGWWNNPT